MAGDPAQTPPQPRRSGHGAEGVGVFGRRGNRRTRSSVYGDGAALGANVVRLMLFLPPLARRSVFPARGDPWCSCCGNVLGAGVVGVKHHPAETRLKQRLCFASTFGVRNGKMQER